MKDKNKDFPVYQLNISRKLKDRLTAASRATGTPVAAFTKERVKKAILKSLEQQEKMAEYVKGRQV